MAEEEEVATLQQQPPFSLLEQLLERAPEVLLAEVLSKLDITDRNLLARVSRKCMRAVVEQNILCNREVGLLYSLKAESVEP
jgi:hypothetical protein